MPSLRGFYQLCRAELFKLQVAASITHEYMALFKMEPRYVFTSPKECSLWKIFISLVTLSNTPYVHCSADCRAAVDGWQNKLSFLLAAFLQNEHLVRFAKVVGYYTEALFNLHRLNGGLTGIIWKVLMFNCKGIVTNVEKLPSTERWSIIKLLDPRDDLHDFGTREIADLCIMASELAYENESIIKDTIHQKWKMHVEFLQQCPNRYQPHNQTQVLIFTDTPERPKAIVVAFRGTQFFNTYDWSTDSDFSFYEFSNVGGVHMGFLEALGVVTRDELKIKHKAAMEQKKQLRLHPSDLPDIGNENFAFFAAHRKLKKLLKEHKTAKVYVTGHSLGGALAVLFCTMLFAYAENDVEIQEALKERLGGVYTFGQPRVGNTNFASYMNTRLRGRYFRVVYSSDIVPRVPFDDSYFQFKHFGLSFFFNSFYMQETRLEEPNKNFFSFWAEGKAHVMAFLELIQSFVLPIIHGSGYRETWESTACRCLGVVFPGLADHSPVNYVNAVRLAPEQRSRLSLTGLLN